MLIRLALLSAMTVSINIVPADKSTLTTGSHITVIGIGRLGLCFALCLGNAGYKVLGVDINKNYVEELNNKKFTSLEPSVNKMLHKSRNFTASHSLDEGLEFSNIYYIAVDTPSIDGKEAYDHKNLNMVLEEINKKVDRDYVKHIIIGCTIFPGYIQNTGKNLIKDCPNAILSYNPSFIAQGNIIHGFLYPDTVLIGEGSKESGDLIEKIHSTLVCSNASIQRMHPASAEIAKLAANCFITTKIAFANMIADIADRTPNADKNAILHAVGADTRIGSKCLTPGYGFGGPCFPRDNRALGSYAQKININPYIPEATDAANKHHALHMVATLLAENKDTYIFTKVTYKDSCPVPIIEESQKLYVAAALVGNGKKVIIEDSATVIAEVQKKYGISYFEYRVI